MCGRFALGVNSHELREQLAHEYFGGGDRGENNNDNENGGSSGEPEGSRSGSEEQPSLIERVQSQQHGDYTDEEEGHGLVAHKVRWSGSENEASWRPRYNVAPKSGGAVVRKAKDGAFELSVLKWGLVPHWTKSPQEDPPSTINAQMESVFEGRPTWKVRDSKRCIIVAQGFYEWMNKGKEKIPHFIKRADGKLMIFAGLWDHCEYKGNFDPVTSFTIITTPVNKQLRQIHSRMPAILDSSSDIETWLSTRSFDDKVRSVIKPYAGKLELYPVDKGVGKVGNDSKDFIKPVAQKAGSLDSLFAKQASSTPSKPKIKSDGPSSTSSASKTEKKEESEAIMNPDEDTKVKSQQLDKIKEDEGEGEESKVKGKKRQVETLELFSSDEEQDKKDSRPSEGRNKKQKVEAGGKEKKTDSEGNPKLEGFFPVID
ncbi:hypothetical protein JCM5350_000329 [Sporobolomyces pararoseus]